MRAIERPIIAVYLAKEDEIDLDPFIAEMAKRSGIRLAAPKWNAAARTYNLAVFSGCDTVSGRYSIREPAGGKEVPPREVDVWIVPGLAFTSAGDRLGYGAGYYDRFLAEAAPDSLKLGVAYPFQILDALPVAGHDIRLDGIVTDGQGG